MLLVLSTSSVGTLWVYSWLEQFLWGDLFGLEWSSLWSLIRVSQLSVCIYSFQYQVCRVWKWILKPKSVYAIKTRDFPVCYFCKCCLEPVRVYVYLRTFFEHSQLCFHVVYPFGRFVMIFPFSYFAPKSSCLSCIRLSIWLRTFSP